MKRIILSLCCLFSLFFSYADHYRVLFIGNSYTEVNNLPQLISNIASSTGDEIDFSAHTPGGCTFQQHLSGALDLIRQGGWDYVVLQEQSQLPSFPYSQFMSQSYPYAKALCDSIRAYNPEAVVLFYMTWGRKNGDQQNCQFFPPLCTYEGMDSLLHERYVMMAQDNQACVAPVGHVWHYLRDHNSDIELYQSDESHPSLAGSYAAACTFYASIFRKSPMSITTDENLPQDMALAIRQAATHLVFDSLDAWCYLSPSDTTPDDTVSIADYNKQHFILYPNPVTNTLTLQFEHRSHSNTEVEILDAAGRIVKQFRFLAEEEITMPVSDLKDGIYFLNVRQGRTPYTVQKFIKKSE